MGTQLPPKTGSTAPIFGACLLWPNCWTDQDATWYAGSPRSRRLCVRWESISPRKKAQPPQFSASVCCGQTAGWIKMPLGTEVNLGQATQLPPRKGHSSPPLFGPCLLWPRSPVSATVELLLLLSSVQYPSDPTLIPRLHHVGTTSICLVGVWQYMRLGSSLTI